MIDAWIKSGYDNRVFAGQGLVALITPTVASNGLRASRLSTRVAYGFPTCIGASDEFLGVSRDAP